VTEYDPYPTVTFAGATTYADNTISSISIRTGRNDVTEQPQPGYANIQLWTDGDVPLNVNLSDSVEVAIQSATFGDGTRTNLITNPSLETNTTSWSGASVTLSRSTSYAKYGSNSLKGVVATTGTNRYIDFLNTAVPIISGQTYTYSCWVYLPTTNTADISLTLQAYPWNATGFGAGINLNTQTVTRGTWTRFSGTFTPVNAGGGTPATSCLFRVINSASWAAGQEIYIDGALLEQSSTLGDYFDGSSTVPIGCAWTGTANASSSTQTGTNYPIFTGIISDIDISLDAYGSEGSIARYSITAVGPLSQLQRHTAGANGYAKEFDGTRILNILTEAFLQQWDEVNPTTTWNDLPTDVTWLSYDGTNIALLDNLTANVDVPGQYELMAYSAAETDAYTLTSEAANSGRGVLWEGQDGDLHYDDYASRANTAALTLTADDILARGLSTAAQWGEIVNDASVTYRAGTEVARDENSIIRYGQLSGTRTTQLHNQSDALTQATEFIESRAYPRMYPEQITSPLHSPTIDNLTRDSLISVYNGLRISTTALPAVFGTSFDGFVEGYTWNLTRYTAELALTCSAYSETYLSIIWDQEPPTLTWAGYTPTTQAWQDL
jgi:hypothetical protein